MEIFDREGNVVEIINQGTSMLFQKDDKVVNLGFDFYIVVRPINMIEQYPHGADTAIVMKYDLFNGRTIGPESDKETVLTVMRRWAQMVNNE